MEYRIAVLGSRDSILGFQALGLSAFPIENPEEARTVLHRIVKEDYGIIYLTEDLAKDLEKDIARYQDVPIPAIILIPGGNGPLGIGAEKIEEAVGRAVGADIL